MSKKAIIYQLPDAGHHLDQIFGLTTVDADVVTAANTLKSTGLLNGVEVLSASFVVGLDASHIQRGEYSGTFDTAYARPDNVPFAREVAGAFDGATVDPTTGKIVGVGGDSTPATVLTRIVTFTAAQINVSRGAPPIAIPVVTGKTIQIIRCDSKVTVAGAAFTGGGQLQLVYANDQGGGSLLHIPDLAGGYLTLAGPSSNGSTLYGTDYFYGDGASGTDPLGQAVVLKNAGGSEFAGGAGSSIVLKLTYSVI